MLPRFIWSMCTSYLLQLVGLLWSFLVFWFTLVFASLWFLLAPFGSLWLPLVPFGSLWFATRLEDRSSAHVDVITL
ncbi:hypothetical protein BZA77DRAFT_323012 [Pyronema omphalodes]|nr:hypothetical protein BZA77DRAFT_323012 [Pyronema omphalodes]